MSALAGAVLGDFSTVLTSLPVLLGQASYSRQAELEADAQAVHLLRAAAISPEAMVTLFEKLDERRRKANPDEAPGLKPDSWLGITISPWLLLAYGTFFAR